MNETERQREARETEVETRGQKETDIQTDRDYFQFCQNKSDMENVQAFVPMPSHKDPSSKDGSLGKSNTFLLQRYFWVLSITLNAYIQSLPEILVNQTFFWIIAFFQSEIKPDRGPATAAEILMKNS